MTKDCLNYFEQNKTKFCGLLGNTKIISDGIIFSVTQYLIIAHQFQEIRFLW